MMKGQIHHLELWVSNLQRTVKFWNWILEYLGYEKYQDWGKGVSWKLGKSYIAFEQADKEYLETSYNRRRVGMNHVAFWLSSQPDLNRLVQRLLNKKVKLLYQDKEQYRYTGKNRVIHIEDPDGIELEFVAK